MSPIIYSRTSFLAILIALVITRCTNSVDEGRKLNVPNIDKLVQIVLDDKQLKSEIAKDFGDQQLKLVAGKVVKSDQQFTFIGKPVRVVPSPSDIHQIHEQHPKELFVSVPAVKVFPNDSATVFLLFHSGNATAVFSLKNDSKNWVIVGRQYGKF